MQQYCPSILRRWSNFRTTVVDVALQAGSNTITFSNSAAYAPDINKIAIAATTN